MTTFVAGRAMRVIRSTTFDDLLPEGEFVSDIRPDGVEFDGDLDEELVATIRDRITSRDDVDQAERVGIRGDRDALAAAADPTTLEDALGLIAEMKAVLVRGLNYALRDVTES